MASGVHVVYGNVDLSLLFRRRHISAIFHSSASGLRRLNRIIRHLVIAADYALTLNDGTSVNPSITIVTAVHLVAVDCSGTYVIVTQFVAIVGSA